MTRPSPLVVDFPEYGDEAHAPDWTAPVWFDPELDMRPTDAELERLGPPGRRPR